jgi:hypothetical protein
MADRSLSESTVGVTRLEPLSTMTAPGIVISGNLL